MLMKNGTVPATAPIELHNTSILLQTLKLERELASHLERGFVGQLVHNLVHMCRIGYHGPPFCTHCTALSAYALSTIVDNAKAKECQAWLDRTFTHPFPTSAVQGLEWCQKDSSWRLIYHLSARHSSSINDFISLECYSLSYCTTDHAISIISKLGPGTLIEK